MPDYFPRLNLPQGMAEEIMRLKAQSGTPWARLAESLGQNIQDIGESVGQRRASQITPEQMKGLQQFAMSPAPITGEKQSFQGGIDPTKRLNPAQQKFLVDTMAQKRTEDRMMALQGLKGTQQVNIEDLKTTHKKEIEDLKSQHAKDLAKFKTDHPGSKELTEEEQNALTRATLRDKNPLPPSIITFKGPRAKTMAQALLKDSNYSPNKAEAELAGAKAGASAGARLQEAGPPQVLARYAQSTKEVLKVAEQASADYPRYGAQFLNTPYNKLKEQTSPEALQFRQSIADLRGHIAAVLAKGYAPQKEQIEEASRYIPDSITPQQLTEDIPFLNKLIDIQVRGMMTPVNPKEAAKEGKEKGGGKYDDVISEVMGGK